LLKKQKRGKTALFYFIGFSESAVVYFGAIYFYYLKMPERKMHAHPRSRVILVIITAEPLAIINTSFVPPL